MLEKSFPNQPLQQHENLYAPAHWYRWIYLEQNHVRNHEWSFSPQSGFGLTFEWILIWAEEPKWFVPLLFFWESETACNCCAWIHSDAYTVCEASKYRCPEQPAEQNEESPLQTQGQEDLYP